MGPAYWEGPRMVMVRIRDIVSAEEFEPRGQAQREVTSPGTITKIYLPEEVVERFEPVGKSKTGLIMVTVAISPGQLFGMVGAIVP